MMTKLMAPKIVTPQVPPIKIQGIKTKLVPFISQSINWNKNKGTWHEPFMGSGVVGFNINPKHAVFSDTNPFIIHFYQDIQDGKITPLIVRQYLTKEGIKLAKTPKNKHSYYYVVRNRFNKTHNPLDFLFLQRSNFNGMIRFGPNGYNVPFCRKPNRFRPALITKIVNQVKWVQNKMNDKDWIFKVADWKDSLSNIQPNDFCYFDPPYASRSSQYFNNWTVNNTHELADFINKRLTCGFALSTWYKNKYRTNQCLKFFQKSTNFMLTNKHYYFIGGKLKNRNSIIEALIVNKHSLSNYAKHNIIKEPKALRELA